MRISIVSPDLSSNAMARTCPIAQTLSRNHEVEILGFDGGDGFFGPYEDAFDYEMMSPARSPVGLVKRIRRLSDAISGDVVYAFRPQVGSLGVALYHKRRTGTPVILDVEDLLRYEEYPIYQQLYNAVVFSGSPTSGAYAKLLEPLLDRTDAVTVSSRAIQRRYGGTVLPYGPDAEEFDPETVDPCSELVADHGDTPLVVFVGTVREHKGLDVLADAIDTVDTEIRLVVAGYDPEDQIPELNRRSGGRVDYRGPIPHEAVPSYLAAASVVPIPQHETRYTEAQVPNKIFEAMSMACPIVASSVGDIPEILEDCGRLVPPGDPEALATAIENLLGDEEMASELGHRARRRYVEEYGRDALGRRLRNVLSTATGGSLPEVG